VTSHDPRAYPVLLVVLNSTVVNWRFDLTITNNNVGTNELDVLPFPYEIDEEAQEKIVEFARSIEQGDSVNTSEVLQSNAYRERDEIVSKLFGLTTNDLRIIESSSQFLRGKVVFRRVPLSISAAFFPPARSQDGTINTTPSTVNRFVDRYGTEGDPPACGGIGPGCIDCCGAGCSVATKVVSGCFRFHSPHVIRSNG
jgi:hypothetical protein